MHSAMTPLALTAVVIFLAACGSPEGAWKKAQDANTIEAYKKFAIKYPESPNAQGAMARIEFLQKTEIHRAAANDDSELIESLIESGTDVNTTEGAGISALHVAASECRLGVAEFLIGKGASASIEGQDQSTPLHHAARSGCVEAMKLLVEHGAEIDAEVPVYAAGFVVKGGGNVAWLNNQSPALKGAPLHWASDTGQTAAAGFLIEKGATVDAINGWGEAPLHLAAASGSLPTVTLLLENGAIAQYGKEPDKRYPTKSGQPVHYAASVAIVEELVAHGATINVTNTNKGLPIHAAASRGYREVVEYYVANDINPNVLGTWNTGSGWSSDVTPLWTAARYGHLDIVRYLESKGGDISFATKRQDSGGTLLHAAAVSGNPDLVSYLLDKGLPIDDRASVSTGQPLVQPLSGMTPLAIAAYYGRRDVIEVLLERGADIKLKVNFDWDITKMAINSGDADLVRYLLENGAEIDATVESIDQWRISDEMKATIKDFLSQNDTT